MRFSPTLSASARTLAAFCLVLAAGCAPVAAPQAPSTPSAATPESPKARRIHEILSAYHDLGQLEGVVLVAERGQIVYHRAFGLANREWQVPNTVDTAYRIASLTKQFTAALVLKLVEGGKLRLEDKVSAYVPELRPEIGERVTIHHLLNHTSGIVDYINSPGFWVNRIASRVPRADIVAIMNRDLEFAPGSKGHYNNSGYYLLGMIIEKVTGKKYDAALEEMILGPLQLTRSGYDDPARIVERMASGYTRSQVGDVRHAELFYMPNVFSGGGMYSTAIDLYRWDRALHGSEVLSEASKKRMFTGYAPDNVLRDLAFGYGWLVGERRIGARDVPVHEHGGNANGFRTVITRYPDDQNLVVILLNEGSGSLTRGIYKIREALTSVLYDLPTEMPRRAFAEALAIAIRERGARAALADLTKIRTSAAPSEGPDELNNLGYGYLMEGRLPEALAVLGLNVLLYPADANAHDSLGEAHLVNGDKARAIKSYERSLELDPKNTNAVDVLRRLGAR